MKQVGKDWKAGYKLKGPCQKVVRYTKGCGKRNNLFTTCMGKRSRNHCIDISSPRENTTPTSKLKLLNTQNFNSGSLEGWVM